MIGEVIKDFRITGRLGRGGMGEVWVAEQRIVKTRVAIKVLLPEWSSKPQIVDRFFNEAIAVSRIKHSGIVRIYDVGFHLGSAFLIMELLEGEALSERIARVGRLPLAQVADIGRQIASVLDAVHAARITHRDLKPDNIVLVQDAELASGERAKVLDFGIAKLGTQVRSTNADEMMGTPGYMAPEQWTDAAHAGARADVYALGCIAFEMCCGRPPFIVQTLPEAFAKHMYEVPPRARDLVADLPRALDDIIAASLAKQPADRPAMSDLVRAFAAIPGTGTALTEVVAGTTGEPGSPLRMPAVAVLVPSGPAPTLPMATGELGAQALDAPALVMLAGAAPGGDGTPASPPAEVVPPRLAAGSEPPAPRLHAAEDAVPPPQVARSSPAAVTVPLGAGLLDPMVARPPDLPLAPGTDVAVQARPRPEVPVLPQVPPPGWWRWLVLSAALVALFVIIVVAVGGGGGPSGPGPTGSGGSTTIDGGSPAPPPPPSLASVIERSNGFRDMAGLQVQEHQVTRGEYRRYLDTLQEYPVRYAAIPRFDWDTTRDDQQPVAFTTHDQATAFCAAINARLPTEDEWRRLAGKSWGIDPVGRGPGPLREWTATVVDDAAKVLGATQSMTGSERAQAMRGTFKQRSIPAEPQTRDHDVVSSKDIGFRCVR